MKTFLLTATMVVAFMLAGCASVKSIKNPEPHQVDGLTYYMPKKDFLLSVTVSGGEISEVDIKESPAYPDMSMRYVMKFPGNLFGDNLSVGINANGLLSSLGYRSVSGLRKIIDKVIDKAIDTTEETDKEQCQDGEYTLLVPASNAKHHPLLCGITVSVHKITSTITGHNKREHIEVPGVFYRQEIPYEVTVSYDRVTTNEETVSKGRVTLSKILFSPSESEVHFMPAPKSFLTDIKYVFNDGVLIQYAHDTILNL